MDEEFPIFSREEVDQSEDEFPIFTKEEVLQNRESSALGAFGREAARAVVPTATGIPGALVGAQLGAQAGTAAAPFLGPFAPAGPVVGGIGGAIIGGLAGSYAGESAQNKVLEATGFRDEAQEQADKEKHPYSSFAGGFLPSVATFGVGRGVGLAARAVQGGLGAGIEAGQELATEGHLDPTKLAMAAAGQAVFVQPRKWVQPAIGQIEKFGSQLAEKIPLGPKGELYRGLTEPEFPPGRPDLQHTPDGTVEKGEAQASVPPSVARGVAMEKPPPSKSNRTIGTETGFQEGSERDYGRLDLLRAIQPRATLENQLAPDQKLALQVSARKNQTTSEVPSSEGRLERSLDWVRSQSPWQGTPENLPREQPEAVYPRNQYAPSERTRTTTPIEPMRVPQSDNLKRTQLLSPERQEGYRVEPELTYPENVSRETPERLNYKSAGATRQYNPDKENVQNLSFDIKGNKVDVAVSPSKDGKYLTITDVGDATLLNKLGVSGVKQLRDELFAKFPEAKTMGGYRLSGARQETPQLTQIKRPTIQDEIVRLKAENEAIQASKEKPETGSLVEQAKTKADSRNDGYAKAFKNVINTLRPDAQEIAAKKYLEEFARKSHRTILINKHGMESKGPKELERHNQSIDVWRDTFEKFPPGKDETDVQLRERLTAAVKHAVAENGGKIPTATYTPNAKPAEFLFLSEANKFLNPPKSWKKEDRITPDQMRSTELLLRSGKPEAIEDVRQGRRIDADINLNRATEVTAKAELNASDTEGITHAAAPLDPEAQLIAKQEPPIHEKEVNEFSNEDLQQAQKETQAHIAALAATKKEALERTNDSSIQDQMAKQKRGEVPLKGTPSGDAADAGLRAIEKKKANLKAAKDWLAEHANEFLSDKGRGGDASIQVPDFKKLTAYLKTGKIKIEANARILADKAFNLFEPFGYKTAGQAQRATETKSKNLFGVPKGRAGNIADVRTSEQISRKAREQEQWHHAMAADWKWWNKNVNIDNALKFYEIFEKGKGKLSNLQFSRELQKLKFDELAALRGGKDKLKSEDFETLKEYASLARDMADRAPMYQHFMDRAWIEEQKMGSRKEYIEGYLPHIFKSLKEETPQDFFKGLRDKHGQNWFDKKRDFELIKLALDSGDFKLKYDNPIELLTHRMNSSMDMRYRLQALKALEKDGVAIKVTDKALPKYAENWKRTLDPLREAWVLDPNAYSIWHNALEMRGLWDRPDALGSTFRGWMAAKQVWTPITLALSGFHLLHVIGNINPVENFTRAMSEPTWAGKLKETLKAVEYTITDPILALPLENSKLFNSFIPGFADKFQAKRVRRLWQEANNLSGPADKLVQQYIHEAGWSPYSNPEVRHSGERTFQTAMADLKFGENWKSALPRLIGGAMQESTKPLQRFMFDYLIPNLKTQQFIRATEQLLRTRPDLVTDSTNRAIALRAITKQIDNRFGEMFYQTMFWNKMLKDAGQGAFLSLSWQVGQVRELSGAIDSANFLKTRNPEQQLIHDVTNKGKFVVNYVAASMMTAGLITYMLTGKMPQEWMDYIAPNTGKKDAAGNAERFQTMFNTREPVMMYKHGQEQNSWLGGIMHGIYNKMVLSPIFEVLSNRDFYGNQYWDPDSPFYKKFGQFADSLAGRLFNPISIAGTKQAMDRGDNPAWSLAGFGPAPAYMSRSGMENRIMHAYSLYNPAYHPYEAGGQGLVQNLYRWATDDPRKLDLRKQGRQELNLGASRGDERLMEQGRRKMLASNLTPDTVRKIIPGQSTEFLFGKVPIEEQRKLVKDMDQKEWEKYVMRNKNITPRSKVDLIKTRGGLTATVNQ